MSKGTFKKRGTSTKKDASLSKNMEMDGWSQFSEDRGLVSEREGKGKEDMANKRIFSAPQDMWIYKVLCYVAQQCWDFEPTKRPSAYSVARILETTLHVVENSIESNTTEELDIDVETFVNDVHKRSKETFMKEDEKEEGIKESSIRSQLARCYATICHSLLSENSKMKKVSLSQIYAYVNAVSEYCKWSSPVYILAAIYVSRGSISKSKYATDSFEEFTFRYLLLAQLALNIELTKRIIVDRGLDNKIINTDSGGGGGESKEGGGAGVVYYKFRDPLLIIDSAMRSVEFNLKISMPLFQQYFYGKKR
jgi:hypothetical protein